MRSTGPHQTSPMPLALAVLEKHTDSQPDSEPPTVEGPPAYETLSPTCTDQATTRLTDNHPPITHTSAISNLTGSPPPFRGIGSTQKSHTRSPSPSLASVKERKSGWFSPSSSAPSKTPHEVQSTLLGLVRDLVQNHTSSSGSPADLGILQSCADACTSHSVSFSAILQEIFYRKSHSTLLCYCQAYKWPSEDGEGGGGSEMKDDSEPRHNPGFTHGMYGHFRSGHVPR